jgi:hypothetical protein
MGADSTLTGRQIAGGFGPVEPLARSAAPAPAPVAEHAGRGRAAGGVSRQLEEMLKLLVVKFRPPEEEVISKPN